NPRLRARIVDVHIGALIPAMTATPVQDAPAFTIERRAAPCTCRRDPAAVGKAHPLVDGKVSARRTDVDSRRSYGFGLCDRLTLLGCFWTDDARCLDSVRVRRPHGEQEVAGGAVAGRACGSDHNKQTLFRRDVRREIKARRNL